MMVWPPTHPLSWPPPPRGWWLLWTLAGTSGACWGVVEERGALLLQERGGPLPCSLRGRACGRSPAACALSPFTNYARWYASASPQPALASLPCSNLLALPPRRYKGKTALAGLTATLPDYALVCIDAAAGRLVVAGLTGGPPRGIASGHVGRGHPGFILA